MNCAAGYIGQSTIAQSASFIFQCAIVEPSPSQPEYREPRGRLQEVVSDTSQTVCAVNLDGGSGCEINVWRSCCRPPTGRTCGQAIPAVVGDNSFDNAGAVSNINIARCGNAIGVQWFKWTAPPGVSRVQVSTCPIADVDTVVVIMTGTCQALTAIGCADSDELDLCGGDFNEATGQFDVVAGQEYYIAIGNRGIPPVFTGVWQLSIVDGRRRGAPHPSSRPHNTTCPEPCIRPKGDKVV